MTMGAVLAIIRCFSLKSQPSAERLRVGLYHAVPQKVDLA